jgi:hypothetical protein
MRGICHSAHSVHSAHLLYHSHRHSSNCWSFQRRIPQSGVASMSNSLQVLALRRDLQEDTSFERRLLLPLRCMRMSDCSCTYCVKHRCGSLTAER